MSDSAITVTLKQSGGYAASWVVFKGSSAEEVRAHLVDYFDLEVDDSLSVNEVAIIAESVLQGSGSVAQGLGAKPVKAEKAEPEPKKAEEPKVDPVEALVEQMREATDTTALRRLWVDNKDVASKSDAVMEAYKARGAELKEAS